MPEYLYLDIETIPTSDPDVIADIAASIAPPKSMSKADTIAEWESAAKPWLVKEAVAKTSFNGAQGSICCIGWAWSDNEPDSLTVGDGLGCLSTAVTMAEQFADADAVPPLPAVEGM
jgi:3'-5' exonuclease